ncbi:hypothetical protein [Nosocomiicoccus ampullae]|uniref:hypothetical protein n=1 Tax=Nosocomiicoccus ampullae TaxID=489910 RepID=UPI001C5D25D9|nr:hypothetical protein [Nosocomiicoccus ampullae]QYA48518.1 hypothetical protein KPF52_00235 [Nosocomiicoccus ampullae]
MKAIEEVLAYLKVLDLYEKLEEVRAFEPNNMASSMLKGAKISEINREILKHIDVNENKEAILDLFESEE